MYNLDKTPILVNPNGRSDGWTYVSTGLLTSLPDTPLVPDLVSSHRYLKIELDYNIVAAAEPNYLLGLNGSTASIGSCIVDSSTSVATQTPRRPATVSFGGAQTASTTNFKAYAKLELASGRIRGFTCKSVTLGGGFVEESSYVNGIITNTGLVISSIQIVATANNNLAIGSRQRFYYVK